MKTPFDKLELSEALQSFTGTERYYKHWTGRMKYTDGVKYLLKEGRCYWLADLIASYQDQLSKTPCQVWQLHKKDSSAEVTMRADGSASEIVKQDIEYTDFPLDYVELWLIDGILLLPSEY